MADYYSILGLKKNASDIEIKSAFRSLAKIYHPDKNPNNPEAKTIFQNILRAYNVLIDPAQRRRYDNSLSTGTTFTSARQHKSNKNKHQKEWTFTDEDIQKRQYYQKYYKAKQQSEQASHQKKSHSDYKYVLFATPIAVALLMLVVSFFTKNPEIKAVTKKPVAETPATITPSALQPANGDTPYSGYFGGIKTYKTEHSIQINNSSNYDAVIVLFDRKTNAYLQHAYVQNSYFIEFSKLPETGVYWKCMIGKSWNKDKILLNNKIAGGFDSLVQYQNRATEAINFTSGEVPDIEILTVLDSKTKNKEYISSDIDFFKR